MKKMCIVMLVLLLVLTLFSGTTFAAAPVLLTERDLIWSDNGDGTVTITGYTGTATDIIIPDTLDGKSVTVIGNEAFHNKRLTSVVIPSSVTTIGSSAFAYNQLTSVVIPSSVTTIGAWAFQGNQLTSVVIPSSVTTIGYWVFAYNQLTDVTIKNANATISNTAFWSNQVYPSNLTIHGHDPSTAKDHANLIGYTFVALTTNDDDGSGDESGSGDDGSGNGDESGDGDESDEGSQDSDPATITLPAGFHKYKKTVAQMSYRPRR